MSPISSFQCQIEYHPMTQQGACRPMSHRDFRTCPNPLEARNVGFIPKSPFHWLHEPSKASVWHHHCTGVCTTAFSSVFCLLGRERPGAGSETGTGEGRLLFKMYLILYVKRTCSHPCFPGDRLLSLQQRRPRMQKC